MKTLEKNKNSLSLYMADLKKYNLLSNDEINKLIVKAQDGDILARQKIVESNLRFVVTVAKKYSGSTFSLTDLIDEGCIGLMHAIDKFEVEKGNNFITYAVWWIRQSILKAITEKGRTIRLPNHRNQQYIHIQRFIRAYEDKYEKSPSNGLIAQKLHLDINTVHKLRGTGAKTLSLEYEMEKFDNLDIESVIPDAYNDHESSHPMEIAEDKDLKENIDKALSHLSDREKIILEHRFGLNNKELFSLEKIGSILDLTKERIRQIEKKTLQKLQNSSESNSLACYL